MQQELYHYRFGADIPLEEAEASLVLALFAVESLHGEAQTRLDAAHAFDARRRTCVIDAATDVGTSLNRIFVGFLRREFGAAAFEVQRLGHAPPARGPEVAVTA